MQNPSAQNPITIQLAHLRAATAVSRMAIGGLGSIITPLVGITAALTVYHRTVPPKPITYFLVCFSTTKANFNFNAIFYR
jgi:hypothetical protein